MEVKIFVDPTKEQQKPFDELTLNHWGEHADEESSKLDFFDLPRLMVLAEEVGEVVSGLVVLMKTVIINNKFFMVGGIGGVVTHTEYRRKGYATKVLKICLEYLKKGGVDVALLCTDLDRLGEFYGAVGFERLDKPYYFLDKNDVEKSDQMGMGCFLNEGVDRELWLDKNTKIFVGRSNF